LPVIVVTADSAVDVRERCTAGGADEVLHKPVALGVLLRTLERVAAKMSGDDVVLA
jgi:CheY-like chemotaxis protein